MKFLRSKSKARHQVEHSEIYVLDAVSCFATTGREAGLRHSKAKHMILVRPLLVPYEFCFLPDPIHGCLAMLADA